ncbi:MAG: GNAT family N-acetyltransferase [Deinococcaceae bacterium]
MPTEQLMFRRATESDIPAWVALVNAAYRGEGSYVGWTTEAHLLDGTRIDTDLAKKLLTDESSRVFLGWLPEHSQPVASLYLRPEPLDLYLGMITVSPTLQNKGLGKQILQFAEREAQQQGFHSLRITVISLRSELLEWYLRHGYIDTGIEEPFCTDHPAYGVPRSYFKMKVLRKSLR